MGDLFEKSKSPRSKNRVNFTPNPIELSTDMISMRDIASCSKDLKSFSGSFNSNKRKKKRKSIITRLPTEEKKEEFLLPQTHSFNQKIQNSIKNLNTRKQQLSPTSYTSHQTQQIFSENTKAFRKTCNNIGLLMGEKHPPQKIEMKVEYAFEVPQFQALFFEIDIFNKKVPLYFRAIKSQSQKDLELFYSYSDEYPSV